MAVLSSGLVSLINLLVFNILEITLDLVDDPTLIVCEKFRVVCFYLGITHLLALAWFCLVCICAVFLGIRLFLKYSKKLILGYNNSLKVFCQIFWVSDAFVKIHLSFTYFYFLNQACNFTIAFGFSSAKLPCGRSLLLFFLLRFKIVIMIDQKL